MKHTKDVRKRIGEASKKRWLNSDYRKNITNKLVLYYSDSEHVEEASVVAKKRWQSPGYRDKMVGRKRTPETTQRIREGLKISCANPDYRQKMKSIQSDPEYGKRIGNVMKEYWKDPEFARKVLHRRTPSGPEQSFITLCEEHNLPYRFVGNGELLIGRKNPDFVGTQDEHKLVEIWGEHFKLGRDPQDLISFYNVRGYDCLVIWASELSHQEQVIVKVRKFSEGEG